MGRPSPLPLFVSRCSAVNGSRRSSAKSSLPLDAAELDLSRPLDIVTLIQRQCIYCQGVAVEGTHSVLLPDLPWSGQSNPGQGFAPFREGYMCRISSAFGTGPRKSFLVLDSEFWHQNCKKLTI